MYRIAFQLFSTNSFLKLSFTTMNNQAYKFYYCTVHDDGCCAPAGVAINPCCVNGPDSDCDFNEMGSVAFDGQEVREIDTVFKRYERFEGGYTFASFMRSVLDSNGNTLQAHPVIDWIRDQVNQRNVVH